MEIKDLPTDYSIKVNFGAFGDIDLQTDREADSVRLSISNYSPVVMDKEEFSALTKLFVQFENQVVEQNPIFDKYKQDGSYLSYVKWLERGLHIF